MLLTGSVSPQEHDTAVEEDKPRGPGDTAAALAGALLAPPPFAAWAAPAPPAPPVASSPAAAEEVIVAVPSPTVFADTTGAPLPPPPQTAPAAPMGRDDLPTAQAEENLPSSPGVGLAGTEGDAPVQEASVAGEPLAARPPRPEPPMESLTFRAALPDAAPVGAVEAAAPMVSPAAAPEIPVSKDVSAEEKVAPEERHFPEEEPLIREGAAMPIVGEGPVRERASEGPRMTERVVEPLRTALGEMSAAPGRREVTLTLTPDSLGELRIRVTTTEGGAVRASVVATTPEARAALEAAVEGLRQNLMERGLHLDRFTVTLEPRADVQAPTPLPAENPMFFAGDGSREQGASQQAARAAYPGYADEALSEDVASVSPASGRAAEGRLDLFV